MSNTEVSNKIHETLSWLFADGDTIMISHTELGSEAMLKNVFSNTAEAAAFAESLNNNPQTTNTYVNLQKLKAGSITDKRSDAEQYVRFVVDMDRKVKKVDGVRVMASAEEKTLLLEAANKVIKYINAILKRETYPAIYDSGNGYHVIWRLKKGSFEKFIACNHDNQMVLQEALQALAQKFNDDTVEIDTTLGEPEQIIRLWGTWNRRSPETPGRPHRLSQLVKMSHGEPLFTNELMQVGFTYTKPRDTDNGPRGDAPPLHKDFDPGKWWDHYEPVFHYVTTNNNWSVTSICPPTYEGEDSPGHRHTGSALSGFRFDRGKAEFHCFSDHQDMSFGQVMKHIHNMGFPAYQEVIYDWSEQDAATKDDFPAEEVTDDEPTVSAKDKPATTDLGFMDVGDWADIKMTDLGNGKRLAHYCGNEIAYCRERGVWFIWNGKTWKEDRGNVEIARKAKEVVKTIFLEAFRETDPDKTAKLSKWAITSQSKKCLDGMISMAKSESTIAKSISEFDQDEHLFNCANGVIDLRSGELLRHHPKYMMTQISRYKYLGLDTDIREAKEFWKFFCWAQPEEAIQLFLQRCFGYSMWGTSREAAIIFLFGDGNNGKGVLLNLLDVILGDYSTPAEFKTFSAMSKFSGGGSGHSDDLAGLHKKRAAYVDETNHGGRFNEGLLKTVTGGAKSMRVSRKGEKGFDMTPVFTFWFASNHKPRLVDVGKSMRRRIKLVKFLSSIDRGKEDTALTDRIIKNEGDIFLSWMVKGAVEWAKQGLNPPQLIEEATGEYFHGEDMIQLWIEECIERGDNHKAPASDCYNSFKGFCVENGYFVIDIREFKKRLEEKGFNQLPRTNKGVFWIGFKVVQHYFDALDDDKIPPQVVM